MKTGIDFQIVCGKCGSLAVKIENPERASRETIVYCGDCGASRGTMGGLRDLALLPEAHDVLPPRRRVPKAKSCSELVALQKSHSELVALLKELQGLRRKVQTAEVQGRRYGLLRRGQRSSGSNAENGFYLRKS
jgi:hypothetical protein